MHRTMPYFAGMVIVIAIFASICTCFNAVAASEAEKAAASSCTICGLLYKFCPSEVGCGYADPSGVTCYCNDWTWCSDHPDCSEATILPAVPNTTNEFDLITMTCNSSDPRQWILRLDPLCTFNQEVVFYPRDELNNIFVMTENAGNDSAPSVLARHFTISFPNQKWVYSNFTISPQSEPTLCLDMNSDTMLPELANCSSYPSWIATPSPLNYLMLQHGASSRCLAIDIPP
jgi:hypothetical protein